MRTLRVLALLLVAAGALTVNACATSGTAADGSEFTVPVEVDNNLLQFGGVTVYVTRSTGSGRRLLGPVEGGQKKSFAHDASTGTYVLVARAAGSPDLVSDQFQLQPGARVWWNLAQNQVRVAVP